MKRVGAGRGTKKYILNDPPLSRAITLYCPREIQFTFVKTGRREVSKQRRTYSARKNNKQSFSFERASYACFDFAPFYFVDSHRRGNKSRFVRVIFRSSLIKESIVSLSRTRKWEECETLEMQAIAFLEDIVRKEKINRVEGLEEAVAQFEINRLD